jgi:hypothetical protein
MLPNRPSRRSALRWRHLSQAPPGHPGRLPQQVLGVIWCKLALVHHDARGEVNGAAGNGLLGQARRLVFRHRPAAGLLPARRRPARPPGRPPPPGPGAISAVVPAVADRERALAWARAERASLLACLDHVTAAGQCARIIALTAGLAGLLSVDGPWDQAITRDATAVQAARHLGDRPGQGLTASAGPTQMKSAPPCWTSSPADRPRLGCPQWAAGSAAAGSGTRNRRP